jgi:3-deoxy-D-manno-octulosonic-acid transferase
LAKFQFGEFRAAIVLIDALIKAYPNHKILVTSTTPTGSKAVSEQYQNKILHYYFPFDIAFIVKRYLRRFQAF